MVLSDTHYLKKIKFFIKKNVRCNLYNFFNHNNMHYLYLYFAYLIPYPKQNNFWSYSINSNQITV